MLLECGMLLASVMVLAHVIVLGPVRMNIYIWLDNYLHCVICCIFKKKTYHPVGTFYIESKATNKLFYIEVVLLYCICGMFKNSIIMC